MKGRYFLSQNRPVRPAVKPTVLPLLLVVISDIRKGSANDTHQLISRLFIGPLYFLLRHANIPRMYVSMVKLSGIVKQRFVFLRLHSF